MARMVIVLCNCSGGFFSGIIYNGKELIGFKDPIGSKPLYYCDTEDYFALSSELKVLSDLKTDIKPILPGGIVSSSGSFERYYKYPQFSYYDKITSRDINEIALKLNELVKTVIKEPRLKCLQN